VCRTFLLSSPLAIHLCASRGKGKGEGRSEGEGESEGLGESEVGSRSLACLECRG
jgi:hypothetical protein